MLEIAGQLPRGQVDLAHPAAAPRKFVGKSSVAHERSTVILPPWQKTMAANAGQSAAGPPR